MFAADIVEIDVDAIWRLADRFFLVIDDGVEAERPEPGYLLLLTYYASHGEWEASRDQTRDPNGLFAQRHELTRSTIGRSSLRVL